VSSFALVDNQGTAYSTIARPTAETGLRKFLIAVRFRPDTITAGANILSHDNASVYRLWFPTVTALRFQLIGSPRCNLRPAFTQDVVETVTHFISLDLTNSTANQGCIWATDTDGVLLNNSPGTGGTFDTRSVAGSGTDYGSASLDLIGSGGFFGNTGTIGVFAEGDGGGTFLDGAIEFLWMDWGGAGYTLPDITQPSVRNNWTADLIGANGQGPTGSTPKLYYTGNAAEWNAGFNNLGSITAALTKGAGIYVDV
jgi:hypothetical protein